MENIGNYLEFLQMVARNQSITKLKLGGLVDPACKSNAIEILAPMFKKVSDIAIDDCTDMDVQQLSTALCNVDYTLTKLWICGTNDNAVSDDAAAHLVYALVNHHFVENLTLDYTLITKRTCLALSKMLGNSHCYLKNLCLGENEIEDSDIPTLASGIAKNNTLELLSLNGSDEISSDGWVNFFNTLQPAKLGSLSTLYLDDNSINDLGLTALSHTFANNSTLQHIYLRRNMAITTVGWQALATLARNPNSGIQGIDISDNNDFDDEALLAWVNALSISKNTMRSLIIPHEGITSRGWLALENLVCNKTTIDTLYDSNHTLAYIAQANDGTGEIFSVMKRIVEFQQQSFDMSNSRRCRLEVARQKIIHFYFMNGEANMQELIDMEMNVMVYAIARIGSRGGWKYTPQTNALLYRLIRSVPSLFDVSRNTKKRKMGVRD